MKLAICTKFQVNRMNCVESRRGGGPIDPSRLRVTIFSRRLLGLKYRPYEWGLSEAENLLEEIRLLGCTVID